MKQSKYYIRVMRPIFQRAILTVEASSEDAAMRKALKKARELTEKAWALPGAVAEEPMIEVAVSEEEIDGSAAEVLESLRDVEHAYALLQADLDEGEGHFIAPIWLKRRPALEVADITQDWKDALDGVYEEGSEAFVAWLERQIRPTNVVDFLAERQKRRGRPPAKPTPGG
jgi:hypothetical protein